MVGDTLPQPEVASIPDEKLVDYVLYPGHPLRRHKGSVLPGSPTWPEPRAA
jgi:hypothetical protein